jgi:hypothetical protein
MSVDPLFPQDNFVDTPKDSTGSQTVLFIWIVICIGFCVAFLITLPAQAGTGTIHPAKYDVVSAKIDSGAEGLVYEIQNPNIYYVKYRLVGMDTTTFDYSIKLFSNQHASIVEGYPIVTSAGTIQLKTKSLPDGTYWLNLMRTAKDEDTYCARVGYPCEISKNLDIIRMDIGTANKKGDEYQAFVSGAIDRSKQPVKGAAWTST